MTRTARWPVAALALTALLGSPAAAVAGGKFLGETVLDVGDGGHEAWLIGKSQDVGYKYSYVAFLWVDLWTWGGTYCVHQRFEHTYVPITPAVAAQLLKTDEASMRPPFWYRYPAGWFVAGPMLVLCVVGRLVLGPTPPEAPDPAAATPPATAIPPTPPPDPA